MERPRRILLIGALGVCVLGAVALATALFLGGPDTVQLEKDREQAILAFPDIHTLSSVYENSELSFRIAIPADTRDFVFKEYRNSSRTKEGIDDNSQSRVFGFSGERVFYSFAATYPEDFQQHGTDSTIPRYSNIETLEDLRSLCARMNDVSQRLIACVMRTNVHGVAFAEVLNLQPAELGMEFPRLYYLFLLPQPSPYNVLTISLHEDQRFASSPDFPTRVAESFEYLEPIR